MKIAILFGGLSFEHEISIVSSIAMKDVLQDDLINDRRFIINFLKI